MIPGPVALVVLDGWGISEKTEGNAIALARKPVMDRLLARYPHTTLRTDGEAVGLLEGQMGNSNVGHLNLGAGRVVYQDLSRIHRAINSGDFFTNHALVEAVDRARDGRALHLLGLVSDGGVHSHIQHLFALLRLARDRGAERVFVHAILDGRDVLPRSAGRYLDALETEIARLGTGTVASVMGRYYAMDRDNRWERTEKAYRAVAEGQGLSASGPREALESAYARGESDEFVTPTVIVAPGGEPVGRVAPGDAVIFFNFRADRARQLTRAFVQEDFGAFSRRRVPVHFVTMTGYDDSLEVPVAFPRQHLRKTLGELVSRRGWKQLRIAETEKYAHVTYFFNGGEEQVFPGEKRVLVPSPKVATYDLCPEMSAREVTRRLLEELRSDAYRLVVLNYANPDMVGHTGNLKAAIQAIETVDACLGEVVDAILAADGAALIVADHGNAERMLDEDGGQPYTAHTSNPVPCILVAHGAEGWRLHPGTLADVAPTLLQLLGLPQPEEMDGHSLIETETGGASLACANRHPQTDRP